MISGEDSYPQTTYMVLKIWSRKQLVGPRMAHDVVNPKTLELEAAKEIFAELYGIQISEVDDLIQQYNADREG